MACYTMRTYEERTVIQKMWNDGAQAKEIADKLEAPLSTIYSELRRGQDGSRLQNQRLRYSADLAQLRVQQSFELRAIAGALGVTTDWLVGETEEEEK